MSTHIRYSPAERRSFALQPETCPDVEKAIQDAFAVPDLTHPKIQEILGHYGFDASDRKIRLAIGEVMQYALFPQKSRLTGIVLHRGTFLLRAALVEQVKIQMKAAGEDPGEGNRFRDWVDTWELGQTAAR